MNCCICGTIKNVGPYLDKIFSNIEKIGTLFENYVIIFYYDHSSDNTLEKIKEYQQKVGHKVIVYVKEVEMSKHRTVRIANARNGILQIIREQFSDYNFFIMMDCDDKCSEDVNINVLEKYMQRNDWDSISFNKKIYYDIWALSIHPYLFSCHNFRKNQTSVMREYITRILKNVPTNTLLKCESAFNGFAVYRTSKFLNCSYNGHLQLDLIPPELLKKNISVCDSQIFISETDCEHRSFHMQAIKQNNARIRISSEIVF
jgi:hypothetical protein